MRIILYSELDYGECSLEPRESSSRYINNIITFRYLIIHLCKKRLLEISHESPKLRIFLYKPLDFPRNTFPSNVTYFVTFFHISQAHSEVSLKFIILDDGPFFLFLQRPKFGFLVCFLLQQLPENYNGSYTIDLSGR